MMAASTRHKSRHVLILHNVSSYNMSIPASWRTWNKYRGASSLRIHAPFKRLDYYPITLLNIWQHYWYHIIHWLHFDLLLWIICKNSGSPQISAKDLSFSVSAPKLWNKLPKKIRDIDTAHFKTALKEHYCTKAYLKRNASWDDA